MFPKEAWLAWIGAASIGCTDPAVEVRFTIPPAYRAATAAVRLQILEPPASEPFTCDDVAFGAVSDEAVRLRTALEVTLDGSDGDAPLSGVSREGDKLFVAEALDVGGQRVAAACALQGTIDEDVTLELVGEAASVAALPSAPSTEGTPQLAAPVLVPLTLGDALGAPLAGVVLRWLVVGPANEQIYSAGAESDAGGAVTAEVAPTSLGGPALVELRPRWARERLPTLRFLQPMPGFQEELPPPPSNIPQTEETQGETPLAFAVGPIGPEGQPGIVALGPVDMSGRKLHYRYFAGRELVGPADRSFGPDPDAFPMSVALHGKQWVALSKSRWYRAGDEGTYPALIDAPIAAAGIGSCDGASEEIAVKLANEQIAVLDGAAAYALVTGHPLHGWTGVDMTGAGCVSDAAGAVHRVVAFVATDEQPPVCASPSSLVLWSDMDGGRTQCLTVAIASVGFAPASGDDPALLMLPQVDEDGFTVAGFRVVPNGDGLALEPETNVSTLLPAVLPRAADFDGDGRLDLIAALITELESSNEVSYSLLLSLAVEHRGERLVAFGPSEGGRLPLPFTDDLDGDGYADLLLASRVAYTVAWMGPR